MKMSAQSKHSLFGNSKSEENFSREKNQKAQGRCDSCCSVPTLEDHKNPKVVLPPCCRKV